MIFVNDVLVSKEENKDKANEILKSYLTTEKLILVNEHNELISNEEIEELLSKRAEVVKLVAIRISTLVRDFKEELHNYILEVEDYIENTRDCEDFSDTLSSFIQVTEALLQFSKVEDFLQKELINQQHLLEISEKSIQQAEVGNNEYVLDLIEYELLPILHNFLNETNEEI
ncbi:hypothetical protein [Psychrobacillus vulpis]|uniref:Uncharacterized protein n=1 Tax=Psychrobacillus vulpis TaxID=2325572 RepID=A0A544TJ15_9BACI|nr:hypothetical protein [Psychrobacillus vulpis]TQR17378.1 hypothetical protein FG384_17970 [Psychrobacillus vulpis]